MVKRILHDLVQHCALCAVDDRLVGAVFRNNRLCAFLGTLLSFYVLLPVCLKRDLRQRKPLRIAFPQGILLVKGDLNLKYK